jgi:hypothetical protein
VPVKPRGSSRRFRDPRRRPEITRVGRANRRRGLAPGRSNPLRVTSPDPGRRGLSEAQVGDHARDQNLFRLRMGAEPCGELHRRPEEVVPVLDGLAGGGPIRTLIGCAALSCRYSASSRWMRAAHRTAATADANAAMMPSPVCLTSRPAERIQGRRGRCRRGRE